MNDDNKRKKVANLQANNEPSPPASPLGGVPAPLALAPTDMHPALLEALSRLDVLANLTDIPSVLSAFKPGIPLWTLADNIAETPTISKEHKEYLLGPWDCSSVSNIISKRGQLMRQLEPLVGQYIQQHTQLAQPGSVEHKIAAWKLQQPLLTAQQAAKYDSPMAECLLSGDADTGGEQTDSYGSGTSWLDYPAQTVYTYSLIPQRVQLVLKNLGIKQV